MKIITIGREFGSGGRELGSRLADALSIPCYDKQIITEVAKLHNIEEKQIEKITASDIRSIYASTIGGSFDLPFYYHHTPLNVIISQNEIIKNLASQGDCIIVGRCADVILKKYNPLNLFVYADKASKLKRCLERSENGESEKEILRQMKKIDKARASNYYHFSGNKWGQKESYHFCINTSKTEIKDLIPSVAELAKAWFK